MENKDMKKLDMEELYMVTGGGKSNCSKIINKNGVTHNAKMAMRDLAIREIKSFFSNLFS